MEKREKPMARQAGNKPKIDTNNSGVIAGGMVLAMLAIVGSFLISRHLIGDISFNAKVLDRKNDVSNRLNANAGALDELQANFAQLEQDGPQPVDIITALPSDPAYPDLAAELEAMAILSQVSLLSIALTSDSGAAVSPDGTIIEEATASVGDGEQEAASPIPLPQPVQFQVNATTRSYTDLRKFFRNVEVALRPMKITAIKLTANEGTLQAELILDTHYMERSTVSNGTEEVTE